MRNSLGDRVRPFLFELIGIWVPGPPLSMRVYHGSPNNDLEIISADPLSRQYDNGTSQLGAFFTVYRSDAERYANGGRIYEVRLTLDKPYVMPPYLFQYLQDPTRDPLGIKIDPSEWNDRLKELRSEGRLIREFLEDHGFSGIVLYGRDGIIKEISSFYDVPVSQ